MSLTETLRPVRWLLSRSASLSFSLAFLSSLFPCPWLFLISPFTHSTFPPLSFSYPPFTISFLSFFLAKDRYRKHQSWWGAERIAAQRLCESRAVCFPVTASDPKQHGSLVDSWPAVRCWVDTGWMWPGNCGIVTHFSSWAGQMYVMLLGQAVLLSLPVFRDRSVIASTTNIWGEWMAWTRLKDFHNQILYLLYLTVLLNSVDVSWQPDWHVLKMPKSSGGNRATAGAVGPEFNRWGLFASPQIIIVTMKQMERVREAAFEKLFTVNNVFNLRLKGEKKGV